MGWRRGHIGRIRIALARLLEDQGITVSPEDLWPVRGYWAQRRQGCYLWSGLGTLSGDIAVGADWNLVKGLKATLFSWDSMGDCVRLGIRVEQEEGLPGGHFEVSAVRVERADDLLRGGSGRD